MTTSDKTTRQSLSAALETDLTQPRNLMLLGDYHLAGGRFHEAAKAYGSLVGCQSDQVSVLIGLGRCFCALGDWAGMQACLEEVLGIDPANETARLNLWSLQGKPPSSTPESVGEPMTWFNSLRGTRQMQPDLIYDVGMNNGDDTAYYLSRGFRVVAIEADPDLCKGAASRFSKEIQDGRLQIVNLGVAAQPGLLDFWICEANSVWNSFDRKIASRDGLPHHSIQVPCQRFEWVLEQYGVPFHLKIDIEGHDYLCIEALKNSTELPAYVSVELGNLDQFVTQLSALGYAGFKCISQFHFLPLQLPPTSEQLAVEAGDMSRVRQLRDWKFPEGASGPFAEDTLGRWLDQDELRNTHAHYRNLRDQQVKSPFWFGASYSFWLDLHAKRPDLLRAQGGHDDSPATWREE